MADDSETLEDERAIELSTIAAIFPELIISDKDSFAATIDIPVSPAIPLRVSFPALADGVLPINVPTPPTSDSASEVIEKLRGIPDNGLPGQIPLRDVHTLYHLPPLTLSIRLPDGYPTERPPEFHVSTHPEWLPKERIRDLEASGADLWEEFGKDQVIYAYIDSLQQAAEGGFGLAQSADEHLNFGQEMKLLLLDFDQDMKRKKFEQETFECGVCLEPKKGSVCHRLLLCGHVFCVACLQDFFNTCIREGDVANVKCLAPNCGKDSNTSEDDPRKRKRKKKVDRSLNPSELLQIPLEQDMVKRYVDLKRKAELEADKTTVYCPRKWCQGAAKSKKHPKPQGIVDSADGDADDSEDDEVWKPGEDESKLPPPSERVAICEDCGYAFCRVCYAGWHGELTRCWPRKPGELTEEEKLTQDYMDKYTTRCPTCSAVCQKTHGCNHMICYKCRTHFCYLCSAWLEEDNPYRHFNQKYSDCYMRLWELEAGDGEDAPDRRDGVLLGEVEDDEESLDGQDEMAIPPPPAPAPPRAAAAPVAVLRAEIHQGRAMPARPIPGQAREGLRRFLEMARNDEEDDWDSDEFEIEFDDGWEER